MTYYTLSQNNSQSLPQLGLKTAIKVVLTQSKQPFNIPYYYFFNPNSPKTLFGTYYTLSQNNSQCRPQPGCKTTIKVVLAQFKQPLNSLDHYYYFFNSNNPYTLFGTYYTQLKNNSQSWPQLGCKTGLKYVLA